MQDIDFDELDRAVSSLISATPDTESDKAIQAANPISVNVDPKPVEATPAAVPAAPTVAPPVTTPVTPANPNIIQNNRPNLGRSMDFIRPTTPAPTMQRNSATTPIVAPITATPITNSSVPTPGNVPIGGSVVDKQPDFVEPPESPFITDAKVEKRPLGAFSEEKVPEGGNVEPNSSTYAAAVALESSTVEGKDENPSISVDTPLPAELQNNLLKIESSDTTTNGMTTPQMPVVESPEINKSEITIADAIESSKTESVTGATASSPVAASANPNVVNSIPQQYPTTDAPAPQNTGPIFDTSVYHNSANIKPVKKSNAWIWILMVVLILIGATIGVGIYLFVK
jgi:hypothetical protein